MCPGAVTADGDPRRQGRAVGPWWAVACSLGRAPLASAPEGHALSGGWGLPGRRTCRTRSPWPLHPHHGGWVGAGLALPSRGDLHRDGAETALLQALLVHPVQQRGGREPWEPAQPRAGHRPLRTWPAGLVKSPLTLGRPHLRMCVHTPSVARPPWSPVHCWGTEAQRGPAAWPAAQLASGTSPALWVSRSA